MICFVERTFNIPMSRIFLTKAIRRVGIRFPRWGSGFPGCFLGVCIFSVFLADRKWPRSVQQHSDTVHGRNPPARLISVSPLVLIAADFVHLRGRAWQGLSEFNPGLSFCAVGIGPMGCFLVSARNTHYRGPRRVFLSICFFGAQLLWAQKTKLFASTVPSLDMNSPKSAQCQPWKRMLQTK